MCAVNKLEIAQLRRPCRVEDIPFETTADARGIEGVVGQSRAVEALQFGIGIKQHGYNLVAIGPAGVGKQTLLRQYLHERAAGENTPSDWCYVHDFADPQRPRALELAPGVGSRLQHDMENAVAELRSTIRSTFESEEYRNRKQQIEAQLEKLQEQAFDQLQEQARQHDVALVRTEAGITIASLHDGTVLGPNEFRQLPQVERERLQGEMERVGHEFHELLHKFHDWGRENALQVRELDREMSTAVAHRIFEGVRAGYASVPVVLEYLEQVEGDVVDSADEFLQSSSEGMEAALQRALRREQSDGPSFRRYQINVLVDHGAHSGAPVVYEDNPTYVNLIGRIEHETQFGALITNFTLIRAGALHRAIGGYLVMDALKVLRNPLAWDALKRTLRAGELRIELPGQALGLVPTVSLEPAPIPLRNTKVVLTADRALYYLLAAADPDFLELFKVLVDFEDSIDRQPDSQGVYAELVATLVNKEDLRPFDRTAVARVIDEAARRAEDAEKLSMHMREIVDLLRETSFWAHEDGRDVASAAHVQRAVDAQLQRAGRMRERLLEAVRRDDILVTTAGESVGQVNGLSVFQLGEHTFGHPTRITARVRLGKGEVMDIEREVELGGPIHSKGVMILAGYLGARYARDLPLSLAATLVFEQSYGAVEGDSASMAELCALLSALSEVPIKQSLAMTGSVNQHGEAQSIGGVNQKIEGFFDICVQRGLSGEQGVVIPKTNVKNLMLRHDVVQAVQDGRFHIYAVANVDDAIELLTGKPAGVRDAQGAFPEGSVNAAVEARLTAFAHSARTFLQRAHAET